MLVISTSTAQGQATPEPAIPDWAEVLVRLTPFIAIVAAIIGVTGAFVLQWWRRRNEMRDLAAALAGEISAIQRMVIIRDYVKTFGEKIDQVKQKGSFEPFSISVTQNFFEVFSGNVDRLGLLPGTLPERITFLYQLFKGVVEDFRTYSAGGHGGGDPKRQIEALDGTRALLIGVLDLADDAVRDLCVVSGRSVPRFNED